MSTEPKFTTRRREFDYVQLHWLEKTTGRPSHEWDIYIIKELIDNALDADEQWARARGGALELDVQLKYSRHVEHGLYLLDFAVCNRAPFPTGALTSIFGLTSYTSNKGHLRYPTRGQQGNALKTILGIPYALRHEFYGDYQNYLKPLVIETGDQSHLISLGIDEREQEIILRPAEATPRRRARDKTCIRVGIDRFRQESGRSTATLQAWAQRYALLNPHVTFRWAVNNSGEKVRWEFPADPSWDNLFNETAPVHWYEYTQLRGLLLVLERERGPEASLAEALQSFAGFTAEEDPCGGRALALCSGLGLRTLGDLKLADGHDQTLRKGLLPALERVGRRVPAAQLGGVGAANLTDALSRFSLIQGELLYHRLVRDAADDQAHPFVLELALAHLPKPNRRVIWTGLNHMPTYEDPFYTRHLYLPEGQAEPVLGLDGFLDAYGLGPDKPVLLVMHIICPNVAFQDFSKTLIDTRPFREPLAKALHELLTEYGSAYAAKVEDLQSLAHALMPRAINLLSQDGHQHYSGSQLLYALRRLLAIQLQDQGREELSRTWFNDRGANARLQGYIQAYAREHPTALTGLIEVEQGRLALPVHPDGHIALPLSRIGRVEVEEACVNKILLVTDPELVRVIIFNNLLTRFDAAILQITDTLDESFEDLLPHLGRLQLPLALFHHASATDCLTAKRLQTRLAEYGLRDTTLFDLGLTPSEGWRLNLPVEPSPEAGDRATLSEHLGPDEVSFLIDQQQQISLFSLTPDMLTRWLDERLSALNFPPKLIPQATHVRTAALSIVRNAVGEWARKRVDEIMRPDVLADRGMRVIAKHLDVEEGSLGLEEAMRSNPFKSWKIVLSEIIAGRYQDALAIELENMSLLVQDYKSGR
jgi:DNA topoisomerase VI subunit B